MLAHLQTGPSWDNKGRSEPAPCTLELWSLSHRDTGSLSGSSQATVGPRGNQETVTLNLRPHPIQEASLGPTKSTDKHRGSFKI